MADFNFFLALANNKRLTLESAKEICNVMQIYMLKRDPQHRSVAEKIFLILAERFANEDAMRQLL